MDMQSEIPGPRDVVQGQVIDDRIAAQQLAAKHVGRHTIVMVEVHKDRLSLQRKDKTNSVVGVTDIHGIIIISKHPKNIHSILF